MTNLTEFSKAKTHRERTLSYLRHHGPISAHRALIEFGHFRVAARIEELRDEGWNIRGTWRKAMNGQRYVEYAMTPGQLRRKSPQYMDAMPQEYRWAK